MTEPVDLLARCDAAAAQLLQSAGLWDNIPKAEGASETKSVDLSEQVKVFSAVMTWLERRKDLAPPEKKDSPFDALRSQFNGSSAEGGRGPRGRPKKAAGAGNDSAAGAAPADEIRPDA